MITFLAGIVGERAAKPVLIGLVVLLIFGVGFGLAKCTGGDDTAQRQAEQTTASGEAIADAAKDAVETITNRTVTEADIDRATDQAIRNIEHATDPDSVRDAVLDGVCGQPSHRNDPACKVRRSNP